jgi:hypothetical protein
MMALHGVMAVLLGKMEKIVHRLGVSCIIYLLVNPILNTLIQDTDALILQTSSKSGTCPIPSSIGGTLSFNFDTPVYFHDLGVLDMDESDSRLEMTYSDDVIESFNFERFGNNAVQRVIVSKPNVKKMELVFKWDTS